MVIDLKTDQIHREEFSKESNDSQATLDILCQMLVNGLKKYKSLLITGTDEYQKSMYAKIITEKLNRNWVVIEGRSLLSSEKGQTIANAEKLFSTIINGKNAPVIIIDNIDAIIDYSKEPSDPNDIANLFKQLVEKYKKEKNFILIVISRSIQPKEHPGEIGATLLYIS